MTDSNQATTSTVLEVAALLDKLRAEFPGFRIWREMTGDRTVYVARRRHSSTQLHTLVTRDPDELATILASSSSPAAAPVPGHSGQ